MFKHQITALEAVKNAVHPAQGEAVFVFEGVEGFAGFYSMVFFG